MARVSTRTIESLLQSGAWDAARTRIEQALVKQPENHWLLTQLGVTDYEQGKYESALRRFLISLEIVPDCPLTLWNLAGALDALGKSEKAIPIYTWLLRSNRTPDDDPCWESMEWTDALKTDCVYRIGVCFQHLKQWKPSEQCFRQYRDLLLAGQTGTYSINEVVSRIRNVQATRKPRSKRMVREVIDNTLRDAGVLPLFQGRGFPKLSVEELLAT